MLKFVNISVACVIVMANRVPVFDDENVAGDVPEEREDDKVLALGVAGHIGNVRGGAELLESFYCYTIDDTNVDVGFGDSGPGLPNLLPDLDFYKEQTFQVNMGYVAVHIFIVFPCRRITRTLKSDTQSLQKHPNLIIFHQLLKKMFQIYQNL